MDGIDVFEGGDAGNRTPTVSLNLRNMEPPETDLRLDEDYGILSRVYLQCTPLNYRNPGTSGFRWVLSLN